MKITVGQEPVDGKLLVNMHCHEEIDGLRYSAEFDVWVPAVDSLNQINEFALGEVKAFLSRLQSAHFS